MPDTRALGPGLRSSLDTPESPVDLDDNIDVYDAQQASSRSTHLLPDPDEDVVLSDDIVGAGARGHQRPHLGQYLHLDVSQKS